MRSAFLKEPAPESRKAHDWPAFVEQIADDWFEAHPMMGFSADRPYSG